LEQQLVQPNDLNHWDFVLRRLFVHKRTTLADAMTYVLELFQKYVSFQYIDFRSLAPGAHHLLKYINEDLPSWQHVNFQKEIRDLSVQDWTRICNTFAEWPFKPEVPSSPHTLLAHG
jgi:transcription factor 1